MNIGAELAHAINKYVDARLREVLIGCIASIERHDPATMRADVKPLLAFTATGQTTQTPLAIIPNIPVQFLHAGGYFIRPRYKRADLVWVTFATHDITQGLSGRVDSSEVSLFSRENASVAHGIAKSSWIPPDVFSEDGLVVGSDDGAISLQIADGKVSGKAHEFTLEGATTIKGTLTVDGTITASQEIEAMTETPGASIKLSTHTHTSAAPGTQTAAPTPGT